MGDGQEVLLELGIQVRRGRLPREGAWAALLDSDLRETIERGGLPQGVAQAHDRVIKGTVLLQVVDAGDVSESERNLAKRVEDAATKRVQEEEERRRREQGKQPLLLPQQPNPGEDGGQQQQPATARRVLKLRLTDGTQSVLALEYRHTPALCGYEGEKIAVTDAPVRRGMLLLTPANVEVLGGCLPGAPREDQPADSGMELQDAEAPEVAAAMEPPREAPQRERVVVQTPPGRERHCFIKDLKDGETGLVKAYVTGVYKRLKSTPAGYELTIDLADGIGGCVARVESAFVERELMGMPASEMMRKKKEDRAAYKAVMQRAAGKLQQLEGLFRLSRQGTGEDMYALHDVRPPDKAYMRSMLRAIA